MTGSPSRDVLHARAELTDALDALEDKLNVPKRVRASVARADEFRRRTPIAFAGAAVSVAVAVAGAAWLAVSVLRRR